MRVSIIIPVYNVAPFIEECLQSVMCQTYAGQIECLIVDDCGTDNSRLLAEYMMAQYHGNIDFKILYHDKNRGLSAARNTGIEASHGDYLFFLDADDQITPDCLETLVSVLSESTYDVVMGDISVPENARRELTLEIKLKDGVVLDNKSVLVYYHRWNSMAQNKLYNAKMIKRAKLRFREGLIHEDEFWSFQLAYYITNMRIVRKKTYIYRLHHGSIMSSEYMPNKISSYTQVLKEICRFVVQKDFKNKYAYQIVQKKMNAVLQLSLRESDSFHDKYWELRGLLPFSRQMSIKANGIHPTYIFRDIHYFLPNILAPIWQKRIYLPIYTSFLNRHGKSFNYSK